MKFKLIHLEVPLLEKSKKQIKKKTKFQNTSGQACSVMQSNNNSK